MNTAAGPNILLVVVDCLRADFAYDAELARTPALDRLRAGGFSFLNTIAATSTTTPCFATLLTGLYPFEHGVRSHSEYSLAEGVTTIAGLLAEAGYYTRAEVTGPLGPEVGLDRGFADYRFRSKEQTIHTAWGAELLSSMQHMPREPWFVLLHLWPLHKSRQVPPEVDDRRFGKTRYGRALAGIDRYLARLLDLLPENTLTVLTGDHGEDIARGPLDRLQKKLRKKLQRYRVTRGLTRRHVATLYRGCHVGHGYGLYETLIKVPLILHLPARIPHGRSELQVRHLDVAPTILELAGAPAGQTTGASLLGMMRGEDHDHRPAYLEAVGRIMPDENDWLAGMRVENRYKYIYAPHRDDFEPQLFDLTADPGEKRNVARHRPEVAARLRGAIEDLPADAMRGARMDAATRQRVMERLRDLGYADD
ncbi:MAG: sulfatase [Candidatus Brocadiia bacterium]